MTAESKRVKTTIKHPRERKQLRQKRMVENNAKLLLSGKFDFHPKEILNKSLLFDLKKRSEKKYLIESLKTYWTKAIFITLSIGTERL